MTHLLKISVAEFCISNMGADITPIHLTPFPNSVWKVYMYIDFLYIFILHVILPIKLWTGKGGGGK